MVLVHESWDLDLGVDLALGPMGQGLETLEFDSSHWALGSGTWDWDPGAGGWNCDSVRHREPRTCDYGHGFWELSSSLELES